MKNIVLKKMSTNEIKCSDVDDDNNSTSTVTNNNGDDNKQNNFFCTDTIKPRKIKPQNIVCRVIARERGPNRPGTNIHVIREFYKNITPNQTIVNVEKPAGYLRKFSPDGKRLISFSFDQTSLEIYRYLGVSAAAELIRTWTNEVVPNVSTGYPYAIRHGIFNSLLQLKFVVNVVGTGKQLNRECSLFTNDNRYVIVGAATYVVDDYRPNFYELYTSNEAITPTIRCPLEDYSLYLVDLFYGRVTDKIDLKGDKIFLSHNQGLYLYNNTLSILSVQHQTIHIYELLDGTFINLFNIGRFCSGEEQFLYNSLNATLRPFRETTINSLKHRFLVFLYRKAKRKADKFGDKYDLRRFYQYFDQYVQLRMWKMQMLDEGHLLIKYTNEEVIMMKASEPNTQPSFYVIYSIWDSKVLAVYENTSTELLYLFENFTEIFRNARTFIDTQLPCSPSNNLYAKLVQTRSKQTLISARGGGVIEATKRILGQLPISAQSYSNSPYLDLSLFSYDEKLVSIMERPKACGDYPIRFFARDSGLLNFRIFPGLQDKSIVPPARRLVAFTFHPTEPFAISIQRIDNDYVMNFHIRNADTELVK